MTYKDFIEKYGDEKVRFASYYKYGFAFRGVDNDKLLVQYGGDHDDIYRFGVNTYPLTVRELEPNFGECGEDVMDNR
jgi:hypothetical protein